MFSITTTESSMIRPMATASPPSDIRFSVSPVRRRKTKLITRLSGIARAAISVARQALEEHQQDQHAEQAADQDRVADVGDRGPHQMRLIVDRHDLDARRGRLRRRRPARRRDRGKCPGRCRPAGGRPSAPPRPGRCSGSIVVRSSWPDDHSPQVLRRGSGWPFLWSIDADLPDPADWRPGCWPRPGTGACRGRSGPRPSDGATCPAGRRRRRSTARRPPARCGSTSTTISRTSPPCTVTYETSPMRLIRGRRS